MVIDLIEEKSAQPYDAASLYLYKSTQHTPASETFAHNPKVDHLPGQQLAGPVFGRPMTHRNVVRI